MLILLARTVILYFLVILVMRLMGKRQIGELQPYEFVITIMISDLALLPMQDVKLPLLLGIVPILTLLLLKLGLSQLQLKSQFARKIIDGEPTILIYNSKIQYKNLKNQQINLDELMEELRLAGYFDLEEIQYAILENNGDISILPNQAQSSSSQGSGGSQSSGSQNSGNQASGSQNSSNQASGSQNSGNQASSSQNSGNQASGSQNFGAQELGSQNSSNQASSSQNSGAKGSRYKKPKTKKSKSKKTGSKNTKPQNSGSQSSNSKNTEAQTMSENSNSNKLLLPKILVCDGKINKNSLTKVNHDTEWITNKLKEYGIDDMKKVLIAFFDTQGNFKYQLFDNYTKENTQNEK
ncbi:hypothetical protein HMPREF1092_01858 [Clostridium thermobutyricum]|uniref:YetF C-terminal domain-containing protein n=2 Tax=Clostridium thermobutyricum TaxID=29372 RepID=N9XSG4_9CLOT|nr:hypothetical protein HMPREF1092_01858 [Clostridium thermobutyricum]